GLEGAPHAQHHVLQDLAVDFPILWHCLLDARTFGFLLVAGDRDAAHAPGFAALPNGCVVDMATEHQGTLQQPLLFRSQPEPVLEGFGDALLSHTPLPLSDRRTNGKHDRLVVLVGPPAFIALPEGRGLSPGLAKFYRPHFTHIKNSSGVSHAPLIPASYAL